jgi:hypothetical protein
VGGARFTGAATQVFRGLARFQQPPLRNREPLVGDALIVFETRDRRARLLLAAIERGALVFGLAALTSELLALLLQPRLFLGRALGGFTAVSNLFFLFVMSAFNAAIALDALAIAASSSEASCAIRSSDSRSMPMRSRSSLIRASSRGCRAPRRGRRRTPARARGTRRRRASRPAAA